MRRSFLPYAMITLTIILILSCTPRAYSESSMPSTEPSESVSKTNMPRLPEVLDQSGFIVDNPTEIISLADTIASNAEIAALENDFPRSHKLFTIAIELITTFGQDAIFDTLTTDDTVFNRIAEFYVDLLPSNYLDSVPSSISSFVSRYQLNEMMNNMDSSIIENNQYPIDCGDRTIYNVPVTYNRRVQQAIKALTTPQREQTMNRLLTRAHFYRPFMIDMFANAGLPTDLTYLPLLESAFNPKAYSPAHASGLWQFIPSTGSMYKMRDNYWVDERRDPIKATASAIAYLTRLNRMFNDWYLSLASYNCGEGRVSRTMARTGAKNYWEVPLPKETLNYVPLFVAYQIIAKNPQCYGYKVDTTTVPFNYDTVKVSDCLDLQKIAEVIGTTYDSLKEINPHLKHWCTPPNMSDINLYLPNGTAGKFKSYYASLADKEKIIWHRYMVKNGDSIEKVAQRFNVSEEILKNTNKMTNSSLAVGRYIVIPIPASGGMLEGADDIEVISADTLTAALQEPQYTTQKQSVTKTVKKNHVIKRGETLSSIARKYNVSISDLAHWNKIPTTKKLVIGKQLKVFKLEKTTITVKKKITGNTSSTTTPAASSNEERQYYTVQNGEGLNMIAEKIGVTANQLIEWNHLDVSNPGLQSQQKLLFYKSAVKKVPATEIPETKDTKQSDTTSANDGQVKTYAVSTGETLFSISQKLGISLKELCDWNGKDVNNPSLLANETLKYYPTGTTAVKTVSTTTKNETKVVKQEPVKPTEPKQNYTVSTGETMSSIADKLGVSIMQLCDWNNRSASNPVVYKGEQLIYYGAKVKETSVPSTQKVTTKEKKSYTVRPGQSMQQIAQKLNVSVKNLCAWNNRSVKKPMVYSNEKLTYYVSTTKEVAVKKVTTVDKEPTPAQPTAKKKSYTVATGETMSSIATKLGVSVKDLCDWNDRSESNPVVYKDENLTFYGNGTGTSSEKESPETPTTKKNTYVVSSGESMGTVAKKLNVTISQLCEWNEKSVKNPTIYSGEKLVYFGTSTQESSSTSSKSTSKVYTVKKGDSMYSIARDHNTTVANLLKLNNIKTERPLRLGEKLQVPGKSTSKTTSAKSTKHVVKKGETLWSISTKYGVSVESISKVNGISAKSGIQIGKTLKIPSEE